MINKYIKRVILPLAILLVAGCQKEANQITENSSNEVTAARGSSSGGCRMTMYDYYSSFTDYHDISYINYMNGLVNEYLTFGWTYKMQYGANKKLTFSSVYDAGNLLYTVQFIYKKNKVIKEIWYVGNSAVVDDETFLTYNTKGEMLRNESFLYDFFVDYTYYSNGALKSWFYYEGGMPVIKAEYTYKGAHKNPYLAMPGMDYHFVTRNSGFGMGFGEKWYSSEKVTLFDENGDPFIDYEEDANQTTWQVGQQNYPLNVDYIDKWGKGLIQNTFEYENCNPGQEFNSVPKKPTISNKKEGYAKHFKPLMHGPSKSTLEKLKSINQNKKPH